MLHLDVTFSRRALTVASGAPSPRWTLGHEQTISTEHVKTSTLCGDSADRRVRRCTIERRYTPTLNVNDSIFDRLFVPTADRSAPAP